MLIRFLVSTKHKLHFFGVESFSTPFVRGFPGQGFDIDIPETCVEDFFSLLASACNQLPELEVVSGFTGRVTNVCRKNAAASFLMSQICMSGQLSINASKQPIRANADTIYLHVASGKVAIAEVQEKLNEACV